MEPNFNGNFQNSKRTEFFLGFYIAFGIVIIIAASLIEANPDNSFYDIVKNNLYLIGICTAYSILAGLITYIFKKQISKFERTLEKDSNIISEVDGLNFIYTSFMVFTGFGIFSSFTNIDTTSIFVFIILIFVATLNIYFSSFWRLTIKGENIRSYLESLKLEHQEWSIVYNSILIGVILFAGGISFTNINSNSSNIYTDGILITYNVLGAPLVWLLRPIHITMVCIRKEIIELEFDVQNDFPI